MKRENIDTFYCVEFVMLMRKMKNKIFAKSVSLTVSNLHAVFIFLFILFC